SCILSASSLFFFSSRRRHTRSKRDWSSDVCSSDLVKEEINILEPELIKNPIPRHAARPAKKTSARHKKRGDEPNEVEETPAPLLAAAESQVWPEKIPADLPKAKFPALPKPASQAVSAPRIHDEPPPLRL